MDEEEDIYDDIIEKNTDKEKNEIYVEQKPTKKKRVECNLRIEELSRPQKRYILNIWQNHTYHFEEKRVEKLKQLLLELFALSPEETENYFSQLREDAKKHVDFKRRKAKFQKLLTEKKQVQQRTEAYKFFEKILKLGLKFAAKNPVPLVVSVRLRCLSDTILEQLCKLKEIEKPDRETTDRMEMFLIAVADWMAIGIEHIHYDLQLKRKDKEEKSCNNESIAGSFKPIAASTPRQSLLD